MTDDATMLHLLGCPILVAVSSRQGWECTLLEQPMPPGLKRYQETKNFLFTTFSCHKRQVFGYMIGAVLILALCVFLSIRFRRERTRVYEIPKGYEGWVFIRYGDTSCPPLPRRAYERVITVPLSGRVCTSDTSPEGLFSARFENVYPDGSRTILPWSTSSGGDALVRVLTYDPKYKSEIDFVGTKDEFMRAGTPPYPWRSDTTHR